LRAAAQDPESNIAPSPRRKIVAAAEYLEVAPRVTAVARDIDLGRPDLTLPLTPVEPEELVRLSERWSLDSPIARLVEALTNLR
jgi:hypothetical protein